MSPFHHFGEFLRGLFLHVPMVAVKVVFLGLLVLLAIWVWRLPADSQNQSDNKALRFWALLALGVQFLIYLLN